MIRIRFKTEQERINGYYELSTKGLVRSLRGGIYEINEGLQKILDRAGISYEIIHEGEILNEVEALRNSLAVSI